MQRLFRLSYALPFAGSCNLKKIKQFPTFLGLETGDWRSETVLWQESNEGSSKKKKRRFFQGLGQTCTGYEWHTCPQICFDKLSSQFQAFFWSIVNVRLVFWRSQVASCLPNTSLQHKSPICSCSINPAKHFVENPTTELWKLMIFFLVHRYF